MSRLRSLLRRPLLTTQIRSNSTTTTPSTKTSDPLRILFCGSDEFSSASLTALAREHTRNPSLIRSIDVVVRPPKPTGRGYRVLREVPLQSVAKSLSLPLHALNTFTGWTPPLPYNLIIAVSFGLFVPPRILRSATYGGLNVHPSLLPDLRGPAPLHRALLAGRTHAGVSLQTLSEKGFDSGEILAQTPPPGIPIPPGADVPTLRDLLADLGAEMLVDGLRRGVHVPPRQEVGWGDPPRDSEGELVHAPKITKRDAEVRWGSGGWSAEVVARRARVLGDALWSRALARDGRTRRAIFAGVEEVPVSARPKEVRAFLEGVEDERDAVVDRGLVRFVAWRESDSEQGGAAGEEEEGRLRLVPYFEDAGAGNAVVVPFSGGGCVRIRQVKLEGEQSVLASVGFKRISYTAEELQKRLKEDPRFGGGDSMLDFLGVDAIGSSVMDLLDVLHD